MYLFTSHVVLHAVDVAAAPMPTKQLATIGVDPVLQLSVVQHEVALPDAGVPALAGVHVEPDAIHEYVFVAEPNAQTEEVFWNELKFCVS